MMKRIKTILPLLLFAGVLLWSGCNKDDDKDVIASFSYLLTGTPGEVSFTNHSANAQVYTWKFGDGNESTVIDPVHEYDENDSFVVTLIAQGSSGTSVVQDTIQINNIP